MKSKLSLLFLLFGGCITNISFAFQFDPNRIKTVTTVSEINDFLKSAKSVDTGSVLIYYSDSCRPCKRMSPIIHAMAYTFPNIKFAAFESSSMHSSIKKSLGEMANKDVATLLSKAKYVPTIIFIKDNGSSYKETNSISIDDFRKYLTAIGGKEVSSDYREVVYKHYELNSSSK